MLAMASGPAKTNGRPSCAVNRRLSTGVGLKEARFINPTGNGGIMRYDLIINGSTVIEDIQSSRDYPSANELLKTEYLPLVSGRPRGDITGLDQADDRSVIVAWDRVVTVEVRIRR